MSNEDYKIERKFMEQNPAIHPEERKYYKALNSRLQASGVWPTTTTSTTTSTSTTSTTSTSSSSTTSTTA